MKTMKITPKEAGLPWSAICQLIRDRGLSRSIMIKKGHGKRGGLKPKEITN